VVVVVVVVAAAVVALLVPARLAAVLQVVAAVVVVRPLPALLAAVVVVVEARLPMARHKLQVDAVVQAGVVDEAVVQPQRRVLARSRTACL
jgi:hypothetical protein